MIYLILAILGVLPIAVSMILLIFDIDLSLIKAYILEMIILVIVSAVGHFYYHQVYGLSYFPRWSYAKLLLGAFMVIVIGLFLIQLLLYWMKKKEMFPFSFYIIAYIAIAVFFVWMVPVMQKHFYADRLTNVEETFEKGDADKVTEESGIKVGLVASKREKIFKPAYGGSTTYNNYVYIRNNQDTSFRGDVYLVLRNKHDRNFEMKYSEDINIDAKSTKLLIVKGENKYSAGKWAMRSFHTNQEVTAIETKIIAK